MSAAMPAGDFPQITSCNYGASTVQIQGLCSPDMLGAEFRRMSMPEPEWAHHAQTFHQELETTTIMSQSTRRIVQVFIADPHPDVPLASALLHKDEPRFTDASDQELYFEIPVMDKLKAHNEARVKWLDKEATKRAGKDVFLDPIKVRDLKMVVVTIAQF